MAPIQSGKKGTSVLRDFPSVLAHSSTYCVDNSAKTCGAYFGFSPAIPNNPTSFLWDWGPVILQASKSVPVLHHAHWISRTHRFGLICSTSEASKCLCCALVGHEAQKVLTWESCKHCVTLVIWLLTLYNKAILLVNMIFFVLLRQHFIELLTFSMCFLNISLFS